MIAAACAPTFLHGTAKSVSNFPAPEVRRALHFVLLVAKKHNMQHNNTQNTLTEYGGMPSETGGLGEEKAGKHVDGRRGRCVKMRRERRERRKMR